MLMCLSSSLPMLEPSIFFRGTFVLIVGVCLLTAEFFCSQSVEVLIRAILHM